MVLGIIIIVLHLICILVIYIAGKNGLLRVEPRILPLIFWLPVIGELCVLTLEICYRTKAISHKDIGVEKLKYNNELHKNLLSVEQISDDKIVPMEEAFLINDAKLRRELILDLLKKDPDQYVDILQKAKTNEDADVVHYASTAIMELHTQYDLRIQSMEHRYKLNPDSLELLEEFINLLEEYLSHGLAEGRRLELVQSQYIQLLEKKVRKVGDSESYEQLIISEMKHNNETRAFRYIQEMKQKWPGREDGWLLEIQYYAKKKQGSKLRETIEEMEAKGIYLSSHGKEVVGFWSKNG